jgi:hypothetical protein
MPLALQAVVTRQRRSGLQQGSRVFREGRKSSRSRSIDTIEAIRVDVPGAGLP